MNPIKIELDEDGIVENSFVPESELVGINIGGKMGAQSLELDFISVENEPFRAHLTGVRYLFCNEFRRQNLVHALWVHTEKDCEEILLAEQECLGIKPKDMDSLIAEIEDGDLVLFQIEPSVGTALVCICESFSLSGE